MDMELTTINTSGLLQKSEASIVDIMSYCSVGECKATNSSSFPCFLSSSFMLSLLFLPQLCDSLPFLSIVHSLSLSLSERSRDILGVFLLRSSQT